MSIPKTNNNRSNLTYLQKIQLLFSTFGSIVAIYLFVVSLCKYSHVEVMAESRLGMHVINGKAGFYHFLSISNIGNKEAVIDSITTQIVNMRTGYSFSLHGIKYYIKNPLDNNNPISYPFISIILEPHSNTKFYVESFKPLKPEDWLFTDSIENYIELKKVTIPRFHMALDQDESGATYDFDNNNKFDSITFKRIVNFRLKNWEDMKEGEYYYLLSIYGNGSKIPIDVKGYKFTFSKADYKSVMEDIKGNDLIDNYSKSTREKYFELFLQSDSFIHKITAIHHKS